MVMGQSSMALSVFVEDMIWIGPLDRTRLGGTTTYVKVDLSAVRYSY